MPARTLSLSLILILVPAAAIAQPTRIFIFNVIVH
jgi:hypothetical protein